jgi:murein DD-endopeptidase MepM/ murein hydrolase activator NlpD
VAQVGEVVDHVKGVVPELGAQEPTVLYGGSVNDENIDDFAGLVDVAADNAIGRATRARCAPLTGWYSRHGEVGGGGGTPAMTIKKAIAGPRGPAGVVLAVIALAVGAQLAWAEPYTVRQGDTLSQVADRLGLSVQQLAAANGISDPNMIVAGSSLIVPSTQAAATEYRVRIGDTLWGIADTVGVPVGQLAAANGLADPDLVQAGSVLTVPRGAAAGARGGPGPVVGSSNRYTVRPGDALFDIASRVGVPLGQLAAVNAIGDPNFVAVGQILTIPAAWDCPVPGASFVNDYGYVRPDARHEGVDLFAPRGTPIVAPVAGSVERYPNPAGGNALELYGRDGNRYYLAHLDRYGDGGNVARGDVIGYVGNTGEARVTSPHLHFEVHPGGGAAASPYPALVAACG